MHASIRALVALSALGLIGCQAATDPALEQRVAALEAEVQALKGKLVSKREEAEQAVVGKDATLQAAAWIQGQTSLEEGEAQLLVFFEEWCPHCKREVPKLQESYAKLHGQGLEVIGVTRLTRGGDEAKMKKFIDEHGLAFPILRDDGAMSDAYAVTGIPAAALVKDGKIVWRGNPARLHENMILASLQ